MILCLWRREKELNHNTCCSTRVLRREISWLHTPCCPNLFFSLLQKVIFLLLRRKCLLTHWFIRHSPGWDISLRLALVLPCAMISFQGEGMVHSGGDFPHQQTPLSLESHTHHLLECTVLRLIMAVCFSTRLFPSLPSSHLPPPRLMHADLHLVSPRKSLICRVCVMRVIFTYAGDKVREKNQGWGVSIT